MKLILVAAVAKNNVIGKENSLPWYLPEDLKRFKELTTGKIVLMGRKTFESIMARNKKPLPNRTNIVITSDVNYQIPTGVEKYTSLDDVFKAHQDKDIYVIGGGSIYKQTIEQAEKLYITHVDQEIKGDVFFPEIDFSKWKKTGEEPHEGYNFVTYEKI